MNEQPLNAKEKIYRAAAGAYVVGMMSLIGAGAINSIGGAVYERHVKPVRAGIEHSIANAESIRRELPTAFRMQDGRTTTTLDFERVGTPNPDCGEIRHILYDSANADAKAYAQEQAQYRCTVTEAKDSAYFTQLDRLTRSVIAQRESKYDLEELKAPTVTLKDLYGAAKSLVSKQ